MWYFLASKNVKQEGEDAEGEEATAKKRQGDGEDGGAEVVSAGDGEADCQVPHAQSPDQECRHTGKDRRRQHPYMRVN